MDGINLSTQFTDNLDLMREKFCACVGMAGIRIDGAARLRTIQGKKNALLPIPRSPFPIPRNRPHKILDIPDFLFLSAGQSEVGNFRLGRGKNACGYTLRAFNRRLDPVSRANKFPLKTRQIPAAHLFRQRDVALLIESAPVLQIQHLARCIAHEQTFDAGEFAGRRNLHIQFRRGQKRSETSRKRFHTRPFLKHNDTPLARIARRERGKAAVAISRKGFAETPRRDDEDAAAPHVFFCGFNRLVIDAPDIWRDDDRIIRRDPAETLFAQNIEASS